MRDIGPTEVDRVNSTDADHPTERDGGLLVGVAGTGAPFYYDPERHEILEGDADETVTHWVERHELADSSVGDFLRDIEDSIGWDLLTEHADEHVEDED